LETTPESILLHVAKNSGFNDAVEFEELHDWIIELNTKLLKCPYIRVKHEASFSLLSNLISHNITLYPLIKDYLSLVALEGKDNDSFISFPILRYLDYFHNYFPNESYSYLVTVFNSNKLEDLCPSPTSNHIFQLIEKLLQANVLPKDHKDRLCSITREFSMRGDPYCKQLANLLMKKYGIT
jgi:hypothetical protein